MQTSTVLQRYLEHVRSPAWQGHQHWVFAQECDSEWWSRAREWGGGFFHHPNALTLGPPHGEPVVAMCVDSIGPAALAVGVRWHCRLSGRLRHAYFPSMPAVRRGVDHGAIHRSLCRELSEHGVDEIVFDSFDAPVESRSAGFGDASPERAEYRLSLTDGDPIAHVAPHHLRLIRRGDHDGWRTDTSVSEEAAHALTTVSLQATSRGATRGNPFEAGEWDLTQARQLSDHDWGVTIFRAFDDDTLLAAALIGWGGDRAFYLGGGSTADGYARGASAWLHWRIITALRDRGARWYNFGGAPADAVHPVHSSHGLHRFKVAFGTQRHVLHGLRWNDWSLHSELHRAAEHLHFAH